MLWTAAIGFWALSLVLDDMSRWMVLALNQRRDGKHKEGNETKRKRRW